MECVSALRNNSLSLIQALRHIISPLLETQRVSHRSDPSGPLNLLVQFFSVLCNSQNFSKISFKGFFYFRIFFFNDFSAFSPHLSHLFIITICARNYCLEWYIGGI